MPDWIQNIDDQVLRFFLDHHVKVLDKSVLDATALGSTTLLALVVLFTLGVLLLHRQYLRAIVTAAVVAGIYFTTDFLKSAVDRTRPAIGKGIIPTPHSPSFPSSHASLSMAIFLIVALCLRVRVTRGGERPPSSTGIYLFVWALILTALAGTSRLYLGVHYLSDVAGGWLLGLGFAGIFWILDRLTAALKRT